MFLDLLGLVLLLLLQFSIQTRFGLFDPLQSFFGIYQFLGEAVTALRLPKLFIFLFINGFSLFEVKLDAASVIKTRGLGFFINDFIQAQVPGELNQIQKVTLLK